MAIQLSDFGFVPEQKKDEDLGFVPGVSLKLAVPEDDFGFVPEQIKPDPMHNELELTLKTQDKAKKMQALQGAILQEAKAKEEQNPKNWTVKQTQHFIKTNPPQNPQDEAVSQVLLDQKKQEKKKIIDDIKQKSGLFTPEEMKKMAAHAESRIPEPGEASAAFDFMQKMVLEGPIKTMTNISPQEKQGLAKTLTMIGDTFARIPEAARAGVQAALLKEPILKNAIKGFITPDEIQSLAERLPYQEWEQGGIASLIPRALAKTVEDLFVYNAVYGAPKVISNVAKSGAYYATRSGIADVVPSFEKAGTKFPEGASLSDKVDMIIQAGRTDPRVGYIVGGLSKRYGLLKILYSEKGSALVPGFKPGEFARFQEMPYKIEKIENGIATLAAGIKQLKIPVDKLQEIPLKDIGETPLVKLLRKGDADEVGADMEKIPESMLKKEPEIWNLVQRSKELSKAAEESQLEVNRDVDLVADALSLTEKQHAQKKGFRSITSKMLRKVQSRSDYKFEDITDYGRGTIIMDDFNGQIEPVIKNLVESGWVPSSDFGKPGFGGFRIFSLNKIAKNGLSVEMQLGNKQIWEKKKNYSDAIYHDNRDLIEKSKRNMTKEELSKFTAMDEVSRKEWEPIYATLDIERASIAAVSSGVKRMASRTSAIVPSESTAGLQAPSSPTTWTGQDRKSTIIPSSNLSTKSDIVSVPPGKSLSQESGNVKENLPVEKNGQNLMEIENANLTLPELKQKLEIAREGGVQEEDPDLYKMIEDDIVAREEKIMFEKPLDEKIGDTYDVLPPEEQAKLELEMDDLIKTPEGNLLLAIDKLGGIAPSDRPDLPGALQEEYKDLPNRVKNKNSQQKLDTIVESLNSYGWFFEDSNELRAAILNATANPPQKVNRANLRAVIREAAKNKKAAAALEEMSKKRRKFITSVKKSDLAAPEVKAKIESRYDPITNQGTLDEAKAIIDRDINEALQLVNEQGAPSALSNAIAQLLIIKAQNEGNFEEAIRIVEHTAERATGAGQAIQALAMWGRLTPEGILKYAESVVRRARKELKQPERIDYFTRHSKGLNPEEQQKLADKLGVPHIGPIINKVLFDMAQRVQQMPEGREKMIETALMMRKIANLIPKNIGKKLAMIQTMAQLLNPKTIIRNILGNAGFALSENISDVFGTALDVAVSLFTGKRTQYLPGVVEQFEGFKKGLGEGAEEALLGVNLKDIGTRFDLPRGGVFDKGVLGALEKGLGLVLQAPDRAAYQAAFNESIRNQMIGTDLTEPTDVMVEKAHVMGLYRTFQDENVLSKTFVKIKRVLNADKSFGVGDIVLKYPFTPANLLARGIEYSPFGFTQTIWKLVEPLAGKKFDQEGFVKASSRAFTGTALMVGTGALLAALGIITGKRSKDRDLEATRQLAGLREYQINLSALKRFAMSGLDPDQTKLQEDDLLISYDWFLPASISVSLGANLVYNRKGRPVIDQVLDVVDKLGEATGTIADQPLVQGLKRLTSGENIFKSILDVGKDVPSSFVPTLLSQIRQLTDNVARNTKDPNYFKEAYNKAAYRIPGLASTLPPRVTTLGKDQEMYQGGTNNPFNVFLNPAFVTKYKPDPMSRMVLDIWQRTGETIQFPRQVQAKIKLGQEELELSAEEYTAFQRYIGQRTDMLFGILSQNASFLAQDDEKKAKKLQGYLTDVFQAGKIEVLGYRPKKVSGDVKSILKMIIEDQKQIDASGDLGFQSAGAEEDFGFVPEK